MSTETLEAQFNAEMESIFEREREEACARLDSSREFVDMEDSPTFNFC